MVPKSAMQSNTQHGGQKCDERRLKSFKERIDTTQDVLMELVSCQKDIGKQLDDFGLVQQLFEALYSQTRLYHICPLILGVPDQIRRSWREFLIWKLCRQLKGSEIQAL